MNDDLMNSSGYTPANEAKGSDVRAVEMLAAEFHDIYQQEAKRQGDVRHKDAYADLPENVKEFDRVLARHVLALFEARAQAAAIDMRERCAAQAAQCAVEFSRSVLSLEVVKSTIRALPIPAERALAPYATAEAEAKEKP